MEGATAIGKMLTRDTFHEDNFKIVLRRKYPHLPESALCDLALQLMPRIEEIFASPNCAVSFDDHVVPYSLQIFLEPYGSTSD